MRIEYMKDYLDFCKTKSISKTAMRFYMTPQGISRILHQLEDEFGVKLFVRDGNAVVITEAGRALEEHARAMVSSYDSAQASLGKFSASAGSADAVDSVCLVSTTCASTYFIDALKLNRRRTLPYSLRLRETNIYRICSYVERASSMMTLGLVSVPLTQKYLDLIDGQMEMHGLEMRPLICSPLAVMMSNENPLANSKSLKHTDVANMPVVCYRDAVLLDALDDFIKEDQVYDITSNSQVLVNQLREWHAISFAPLMARLLDSFDSSSMTIVPFEPGEGFFDTRFGIIGKPEDLEDERTHQLIARIREMLLVVSGAGGDSLFTSCADCSVDHYTSQ